MSLPEASPTLRLTLSRSCAWSLLIAGWIGIGSLAQRIAPDAASAFTLVALWLLALGGATAIATRSDLQRGARGVALALSAVATVAGLAASRQGGGMLSLGGLLLAVLGWAALTALASGVVRSLRLALTATPRPPIGAASLGALAAGLVLGDPGDVSGLVLRLMAYVVATTALLAALQASHPLLNRRPGCRAGLFDCSLPAWPTGAWRDREQWPTLLAGLAMLPMMAALPLLAEACRATLTLSPQAMLLAHLVAMFGPAWALQGVIASWTTRHLALACAVLLAAGAASAAWGTAPFDGLGLTACHGAAWGLAWAGQLWAPARRGSQGASPWRAAAGYAGVTLAFGAVVQIWGLRGVAGVHIGLGVAAVLGVVLHRILVSAGPAKATPRIGQAVFSNSGMSQERSDCGDARSVGGADEDAAVGVGLG